MAKKKEHMVDLDPALVAEYRALAKRSDQRLVRLEKAATQQYYKGVLSYSYKRAMKDIESYSTGEHGPNWKPRFNKEMPTDERSVRAKMQDMKRFLQAPTSTKAGIKKIYVQRAKTLNEKMGTNFTWQELANYYETAEAEKNAKLYGSQTLMQALQIIKDKHTKKEAEKIREANKKNIKDLSPAEQIVLKLEKQGLDYDALFGGNNND